jgi:hypothetical protein
MGEGLRLVLVGADYYGLQRRPALGRCLSGVALANNPIDQAATRSGLALRLALPWQTALSFGQGSHRIHSRLIQRPREG